jgi:DNA-binding LacI/PurR family transcriptional regulator
MPSELRHIFFTAAEVVEAVLQFQQKAGIPVPKGSIIAAGCEPTEADEPVQFKIEIACDGADKDGATAILCAGSQLAAALLVYCKHRNIPVPARADKAVQRFGSKIGLVMSTNTQGEKLARV